MTFGLVTHMAPKGSLEHIHISVPFNRSGRSPPGLQSSHPGGSVSQHFQACHSILAYSARCIRPIFDRQYSLNCPRYSLRLSTQTAFSFRPVSLSTLAWDSLKTDNTWSFMFSSEAHSFRLWSSMNVTKYCDFVILHEVSQPQTIIDPACDFVSTWHTSVCTSALL